VPADTFTTHDAMATSNDDLNVPVRTEFIRAPLALGNKGVAVTGFVRAPLGKLCKTGT